MYILSVRFNAYTIFEHTYQRKLMEKCKQTREANRLYAVTVIIVKIFLR